MTEYVGLAIAMLGAGIAVGFACSGSAMGVGIAGQTAATVIAEDPSKFSQLIVLVLLPGTQGLYGLVCWFFCLMKLGMFAGEFNTTLTAWQGLMFFAACMPVAIGEFISAIFQGKCTAYGCRLVGKRTEEVSKGIILGIMVEFYAILSLLASFLMLNSINF